MPTELIKQLLEAGVHFGHQTRRWNPKMKDYIFGERSGIYIIDLEKTADYLQQAYDKVRDVAAKGGRILFIGTKKQAQDVVKETAEASEMFFVRHRWLGGLLTNYETVKKSIQKLDKIEKMEETGIINKLSKKEAATVRKEKQRLVNDIGGIRGMGAEIPDLVIVVDTKREEIAIKEANKLNIPIVGLVDTNCDPEPVDFPIPSNDDAVKSIRFILNFLVKAINEGRKEHLTSNPTAKKSVAKKSDTDVKQKETKVDASANSDATVKEQAAVTDSDK